LTFSGADAIYRLSLLFTQQKLKAGNSPKPTTVAKNNHPPKIKIHPELVQKNKKRKTKKKKMGGGSNTFCKKRKRKGRRGGTTTHNQQCKSCLFPFSLSHRGTLFLWEKQS
jgi:hypothetical protein